MTDHLCSGSTCCYCAVQFHRPMDVDRLVPTPTLDPAVDRALRALRRALEAKVS